MANPIVTFTMENGDVMKAELYPVISSILFRKDSMTDLYFTE